LNAEERLSYESEEGKTWRTAGEADERVPVRLRKDPDLGVGRAMALRGEDNIPYNDSVLPPSNDDRSS